MITILKNALIIYLGLLGLNPEYESQCPQIAIKILRSIPIVHLVNEVKILIIPIIKELPPKWIRPLILSSLMMVFAFIISLIYSTLKITYSLILNLVYIIIIAIIISICLGLTLNFTPYQQIFQQQFEQIKLFYQ